MKVRFKWHNIFIAVITALGFGFLLLYSPWLSATCSEAQSKDVIRAMCHSFAESIIDGRLCNVLCGNNHPLVYKGCLASSDGKVVLQFLRSSTSASGTPPIPSKIILKSSQNSMQFSGRKLEPHMSWFTFTRQMLFEAASDIFRRRADPDELMRDFWDWPLTEAVSPAVLKNSVWALANQREYFLMKHLESWKVVPRVHGTCGPLYAVGVTATPALLRPSLTTPLSPNSWLPRAKLARKLLHLLRVFDLEVEPRLAICDMKMENFGQGADGGLRLFDLDTVLPEDDVFRGDCDHDRQCGLLACEGRCRDGTCVRANDASNLRAACAKIFSGTAENGWQGLLLSSPARITPKVNAALEQCLEPAKKEWLESEHETRLTEAYLQMDLSLHYAISELLE